MGPTLTSERALVGRMRKDLAALMHIVQIDDSLTLETFKIILERLHNPQVLQEFLHERYQN